MRYITTLIFALGLLMVSPAHAGMRLSLVMVTPDQVALVKRDENALAKLLFASQSDSLLSMDKEWQGIHYLLTGEAWSTGGPLGQVILGGSEFGPDLGYGPARLLSPSQVKEIAARLKDYTLESFKSRYDPKAMMKAQIYPEVWEREGNTGLVWLVAGYQRVVEFYGRAAAQGKAVILAIL